MNRSQVKILVVDDQQANLDSLVEALEPLSLDIRETTDPEKALKILEEENGDFAVALLDVQMPIMDGFTLATKISELPLENKPPIIFLTAIHKEPEYIQKGYYSGAVDYLSKPLNLHILRSKLSVFVEIYTQNARNLALSKDLAQTVEKLETANKSLASFAYIVSHDLKAPLRHLEGFIQSLLEQAGTKTIKLTPEAREAYMDRMQRSINRMRRIIDDILNFARFGLSEVEKSELKLTELFQLALEPLEKIASEQGARIELEGDLQLHGDKDKLTIVFQNLFENAIKYKSPKRALELKVRGEKRGDSLLISFEDNGLGIKEKYLSSVFEFMKRLHTEDEISGTGIGLSTCEKIILAHKGKIWVESDGSSGSCFKIELPCCST